MPSIKKYVIWVNCENEIPTGELFMKAVARHADKRARDNKDITVQFYTVDALLTLTDVVTPLLEISQSISLLLSASLDQLTETNNAILAPLREAGVRIVTTDTLEQFVFDLLTKAT